jgi:DNA-binding response OmpR family regulator
MNQSIDNSKISILITDDNAVCVRALENILKDTGYKILTAFCGKECIEKTREFRPDLILLDVVMPEINGIDVCKEVKKDPEISDTPVIFITADTGDETLKEAFDAGGNDYIRKPVKSVEVHARIKSLLIQKEFIRQKAKNDALTAIVEMAGAVCHEMSQPMQAILGYSELATALTVDNGSKAHDIHERLQKSIMRLAKLKMKLIRITRYETKPYLSHKIVDIDRSAAITGNFAYE